MHRLRLAAPTPEHAQRGKAFTVKLQLAKENGAVPLPPGAAPGGCPVRIELRTADLTPLGGESILAVEPVGAKRLALAADGSCAARVTVLQGCNKVHYGPGHTTECFHTITCPLFLYCEATLPLAAAAAATAAGAGPAGGKKGKNPKGKKGGKPGKGGKGAAPAAAPATSTLACVSPAVLVGPAAADLQVEEAHCMPKQMLQLADPGGGGGAKGGRAGVELLVCERSQLYQDTLPGFAGVIWDSAFVLARHIANSWGGAAALKGKKVVEIGCGVALPALTSAACGAKALLTDQLPALAIPTANAAANASRLAAAGGSAHVAELCWGQGHEPALLERHGPFDYVLCSDCVYANEAFESLAATLQALCTPKKSVVLLSFKERKMNGRGSGCDIALFFEIIERFFSCVECKTSQALRSEIEQTRVSAMVSEVRLYELRLRPSKKQQANSSSTSS